MAKNDYKEVDFYKYCKSCKHVLVKESEEPCDTCLNSPTNLHSKKPVKWEHYKK